MPGPTIRLTFAGDSSDLERAMSRVGNSAGQMEREFSGKSAAMAAAGAAAGAALIAGFSDSLETQDTAAKLQAQMGAGTPIAKQAGEVAGSLYAQAYGENLGEVNEAVRSVMLSIGGMQNASSADVEAVTGKVMSLAQAFDQDVGGAATAVGQMMKTGLAPDAASALDIITVGFQHGADKAGDFLDTLNEYGVQFQKVGLDGATATGLISQGLLAGARDADLVADAIKEFSIRAIDGSATTVDGFKSIGLSADDMRAKIAKGGPEAAAALDLTLDKLRAIQDPAERSRVAVELFGTQAEDLGAALFALDPSTAVAGLGQLQGAADTVNATLGETASQKIEAVKRGFEDWKNTLIGVQGPLGSVAAGIFTFGGDALNIVGSLGMAGMALRGLGVASGIATAAQWLWNAALSANPIGIVVLAIAALVAGLIWAWNNSETFRNIVLGVWNAVKAGISAAVDWIRGAISWFANLPGMIGGWFSSMASAAIGKAGELVSFVRSLPGKIMSAIGNLGSLLLGAGRDLLTGLWNGISGAAGWLKDKIFGFFGSLLPGWAKDILGIHSPSVVFAQEIGEFIPPGVGVGMESAMPGLIDQARSMTDDLLAAAQIPDGSLTAPVLASSGMAPSGASGGSVSVNFTGNTSDALATVIMEMIRIGKIQLVTS